MKLFLGAVIGFALFLAGSRLLAEDAITDIAEWKLLNRRAGVWTQTTSVKDNGTEIQDTQTGVWTLDWRLLEMRSKGKDSDNLTVATFDQDAKVFRLWFYAPNGATPFYAASSTVLAAAGALAVVLRRLDATGQNVAAEKTMDMKRREAY